MGELVEITVADLNEAGKIGSADGSLEARVLELEKEIEAMKDR